MVYAKQLHSFYWGQNNHWISDSCNVFQFLLPWGYCALYSFRGLISSSIKRTKNIELYFVPQINLRNPPYTPNPSSDQCAWHHGLMFRGWINFSKYLALFALQLDAAAIPVHLLFASCETKKLNLSFNFLSVLTSHFPCSSNGRRIAFLQATPVGFSHTCTARVTSAKRSGSMNPCLDCWGKNPQIYPAGNVQLTASAWLVPFLLVHIYASSFFFWTLDQKHCSLYIHDWATSKWLPNGRFWRPRWLFSHREVAIQTRSTVPKTVFQKKSKLCSWIQRFK